VIQGVDKTALNALKAQLMASAEQDKQVRNSHWCNSRRMVQTLAISR